MMNFILKNGTVIDPANNISEKRDIFIRDGKVYTCDVVRDGASFEIIDCEGKIISPGFIDVHTHLRDPGFEYKEDISSGLRSAVAGGMTTIFSMPNTMPVADNTAVIDYIIEKSKKEFLANVLPVASISLGSSGTQTVDFNALIKAGAVSFSDDGKWVADSSIMMEAFKFCAKSAIRIIQHCEDKGIAGEGVINYGSVSAKFGLPGIPSESETSAIYRDISISAHLGAKLHIAHISTEQSLELIVQAKKRKIDVTCEVTPHHLLLDQDMIDRHNADFKVNPPLRSRNDRLALVEGLREGFIDIVATDHAPHAEYEKNEGFIKAPFGMIGLETAFPLLYTYLVKEGLISLESLISKMSHNPAKVFNLKNKGSLSDGCDADLIIIDLNSERIIDKKKLLSKSSNTPFHGWKVFGEITDAFVGGSHIYNNGNFLQKKRVVI